MAQDPHHSVSSLKIAAGLAERWRMDRLAVKTIFRQRLIEIGRANAHSRHGIVLPPGIKENKTMSVAIATRLESAAARPLWLPLAVSAGCATLAEWLFYDRPVGVSLALYLAALAVAGVACNGVRATRSLQIVMTIAFIAGLIALVEDINVLSVTWSTLTTALFVIALTGNDGLPWQQQLFEATMMPLRGPFHFATDLFEQMQGLAQQRPQWLRLDQIAAWMIPLASFAVFLGLFALANPLIEYHLTRIGAGGSCGKIADGPANCLDLPERWRKRP